MKCLDYTNRTTERFFGENLEKKQTGKICASNLAAMHSFHTLLVYDVLSLILFDMKSSRTSCSMETTVKIKQKMLKSSRRVLIV